MPLDFHLKKRMTIRLVVSFLGRPVLSAQVKSPAWSSASSVLVTRQPLDSVISFVISTEK